MTVPPAQLDALQRLYGELDLLTSGYLEQLPSANCPVGCHLCCTRAAPLVSDVEYALIERFVSEQLQEASRREVAERSVELRAKLELGASDDFRCPLLDAGRCLVYPVRPHLCRTFGHTARSDPSGRVYPFSCAVLQQQVREGTPPAIAFRITALKQRVTGGTIADSYLPIWLSTEPHQREVRWCEKDRAVVVAADSHRVLAAR
jgi:Fe-S-cluster containining protein